MTISSYAANEVRITGQNVWTICMFIKYVLGKIEMHVNVWLYYIREYILYISYDSISERNQEKYLIM